MKIKLITGCSPEYKPLAAITDPTKEAYAELWGYDFHAETYDSDAKFIVHQRIFRPLLDLHKGDFEYLFFSGTDTAITNKYFYVEDILRSGKDFYVCADGNGLQCDVWILRRCEQAIDFLTRVLALLATEANEQDAMNVALSGCANYGDFKNHIGPLNTGGAPAPRELVQQLRTMLNQSPLRVEIVPQKVMNAYPVQKYGGTGQEAHSWQPGDFICHLPAYGLEDRIKFFSEILSVKTNPKESK